MKRAIVLLTFFFASLLLPTLAAAAPPSWARAHGYYKNRGAHAPQYRHYSGRNRYGYYGQPYRDRDYQRYQARRHKAYEKALRRDRRDWENYQRRRGGRSYQFNRYNNGPFYSHPYGSIYNRGGYGTYLNLVPLLNSFWR